MIRARFETPDQIFPDCPDTVILPLSVLHEVFGQPFGVARVPEDGASTSSMGEKLPALAGKTILAEIPALIWPGREGKVREQLEAVQAMGINHVVAENLGAVALGKELGFTVHGGTLLNVLNSEALQQCRNMGLADVTLSFELPFAETGDLAAPDTGLITYGYLPLMKYRNCPAQGKKGCGSCSGRNALTDRKGERFPILCRERQYSELLNCVPLYVGDRRRPKVGFETLYFTIETRDQCREVYRSYLAGATVDFRRTAGLYFREVL